MNYTILPWLIWALLAVTAVWATKAHAVPIYEAISEDGVKIVLHDDLCRLDAVTNLKSRVTWHEKGKVSEGCYGQHPSGVLIAYFDDKTVALFPMNAFRMIRAA